MEVKFHLVMWMCKFHNLFAKDKNKWHWVKGRPDDNKWEICIMVPDTTVGVPSYYNQLTEKAKKERRERGPMRKVKLLFKI